MRYWRDAVFRDRPSTRLLAGALVGLAVLTKVSGALLGLVVAAVVLWQARQERSWQRVWRDGVPSAGISLLIAGVWFIRNQQ